ncbi:ROK family protein [Kyrpidia tusciae]|uniref:ROK family protein n=1 Tax=Kyrpidia tusciae (strain DSM 2912 / NBRC 15312 / T2) TaxID=562970 RepID=D5WSR5_KYRT2|nr:ROK family protein [Kyrpidia tusciae]ADG07084.1 ROK family protein [Kyrpidia tusciae DSM 2912]
MERVVAGIDVGGTRIKAGLVFWDGTVVARGQWPTEAGRGPDWVLRRLGREVRDLAVQAGVEWRDVVGVGAAWPAFLDLENGWMEEAVNLHWKKVPIRELMERELGKPVVLDNDANAAALGETWIGAGKGAASVLCVTIGTGIGGGIAWEGKVYRGALAMAGEIGHLPMKPDGEPCTCGSRGCLETLASATALVREGRRRGLKGPSGGLVVEDLFTLVRQGDGRAAEVIREATFWLGRGLAAAANLLSPDVIVVGGGVARAGDLWFTPLDEAFRRWVLPRVARHCRLSSAFLGDDAGVLGAAKLAWQSFIGPGEATS